MTDERQPENLEYFNYLGNMITNGAKCTGEIKYGVVSVWQASACHTDTTPTIHTETPTHIKTRTHNEFGDTIEKSQAPDDGCINVRNMSSIEEVK